MTRAEYIELFVEMYNQLKITELAEVFADTALNADRLQRELDEKNGVIR